MSRPLQKSLEDARDSYSHAVETVLAELGELFVEGYGGNSWGCTESTRSDDVSWFFKYEADSESVQFAKAEYTYEQPVFERNWWQMERVGTEIVEREAWVVSKYGLPNYWDILHVAPSFTGVVDNYLQSLSNFNAHGSVSEIKANNPSLVASIEALETAEDNLFETADSVRWSMDIEDLVVGIENGYDDMCAVGICDDEEDKDSIFKMFKCTNDGKGLQDTKREIVFQGDDLALVHVQRWFKDRQKDRREVDYDGEWYSVAYVVGCDDGDTPFFIHRLQDSSIFEDVDEWTAEKVYDQMGFDKNASTDGEITNDTRYRVQGDVYFERRDVDEEVEMFCDRYVRNTARNIAKEYADEFLSSRNLTDLFTVNSMYISSRLNQMEHEYLFDVTGSYDTPYLKEVQETINLSEERIREIQDERGWSRLSQKRRHRIICDVLEDRLFQWVEQNTDASILSEMESARNEQENEFLDTEKSCPITLGNHLVNTLNATLHPNSRRRMEEDIEVVVPEETQLFVLHDEHNSKMLTIPKGIYHFGFLNQHLSA